MEWVEVTGKTVEVAVGAALEELGLSSVEEAEIEVLQEPSRGFLGLGGQDAIVKVIPRPKKKGRRRRRGGRGGGKASDSKQSKSAQPKGDQSKRDRPKREQADSAQRQQPKRDQRRGGQVASKKSGGDNAAKSDRGGSSKSSRGNGDKAKEGMSDRERPKADINEQAEIVVDFLSGLLDAFGLEGKVATRIEEETLHIDVTGDQTEALVGPRGSIMSAVNELTRTVVQRKTHGAPRMRLDICGYTERRREALRIYSTRLGQQVAEQGGEVALEPMHAADRKVVHDTIAEIDGASSYSEGEDPHRYVVIALAEGFEPSGSGDAGSMEDDGDGGKGSETGDGPVGDGLVGDGPDGDGPDGDGPDGDGPDGDGPDGDGPDEQPASDEGNGGDDS